MGISEWLKYIFTIDNNIVCEFKNSNWNQPMVDGRIDCSVYALEFRGYYNFETIATNFVVAFVVVIISSITVMLITILGYS